MAHMDLETVGLGLLYSGTLQRDDSRGAFARTA